MPPLRERTFLQLFPWKNLLRAAMLALLIVAIVAIKKSTGSLLIRLGDLWGSSANSKSSSGDSLPPADVDGRQIRLGPGLAPDPRASQPPLLSPTPPRAIPTPLPGSR